MSNGTGRIIKNLAADSITVVYHLEDAQGNQAVKTKVLETNEEFELPTDTVVNSVVRIIQDMPRTDSGFLNIAVDNPFTPVTVSFVHDGAPTAGANVTMSDDDTDE